MTIKFRKFVFLMLILIFAFGANQTSSQTSSSGFLEYQEGDISFQTTIHLQNNNYFEQNVTITSENNTMTMIAKLNDDSGVIWGVFFEPLNNYYNSKEILPDPRGFCSFHLLIGERHFENVAFYGVVHQVLLEGEYVLAVYNLETYSNNLNLDLVILNKIIGEEIELSRPSSFDQLKFLLIVFIFIFSSFVMYKIIDKLDKLIFKPNL